MDDLLATVVVLMKRELRRGKNKLYEVHVFFRNAREFNERFATRTK